jgi:hypothetical protein
MYNLRILILAAFLTVPFFSHGQRFVTTKSFDRLSKVYGGVGITAYFGELRRSQDPGLQPGIGFNIGYDHLFTDNIALRAQLGMYTIKSTDALATDPDQRERNLNFKATNFEFMVEGMYYVFRHPRSGYRDRAFVNPFFHLGVGVTTNNPIQTLNGTDYKMRPLSIEGEQYGSLALMVPLGFGFDVFVSRNWDVQFDFRYNYVFSGYLDDVNGVYRDQASFTDTEGVPAATMAQLSDPRTALTPPVAAVPAGTNRGNGTNDAYLVASIRVAYHLPKSLYGKSSIRCKVVKRTR